MAHQLTSEEVREVLTRAEEIYLRGLGGTVSQSEILLKAAEEAGLPREAVEQALRERLDLMPEPPSVGEMAFAESADGKFYVAEVLAIDAASARVRFLKGGERSVPVEKLRPSNFVPGERVVCPWPDWGWWTCTIVSYNSDKRKVKVSDGWGGTETFPISEIRLDPPRNPSGAFWNNVRVSGSTLILGMLGSGVAGALITWLVLR